MAADFIGAKVLVVLKPLPNAPLGPPPTVEGIVAEIVGQHLTLRDVRLGNGVHVPQYHIDSGVILDLEVQKNDESVLPTVSHGPFNQNTPQLDTRSYSIPLQNAIPAPKLPSSSSFVDPAILSYSRPLLTSTSPDPSANGSHAPKLTTTLSSETVRQSSSMGFPASIPSAMGTSTNAPPIPTILQRRDRTDSVTSATLVEPFSHVELHGESELDGNNASYETTRIENLPQGRVGAAPLEVPAKYTGKRSRRGKNRPPKESFPQPAPQFGKVEDQMLGQKKSQFKAQGWRQTPLVEEHVPVDDTQSKSGSKQQGKNRQRKRREEQNGWATEDATDIQDMGDFDFESNLSKFDKHKVFAQIRNDDTTADEDRLVSFNRKPRPGTNGGRNLHYTENVLDPTSTKPKWISEETDEEDNASSGRASRRATSRASQQISSRKGSGVFGQAPSLHLTSLSRAQYASSRTESPRPVNPMNGSVQLRNKSSLRIAGSNRPCPSISPLQMLEVEQLSISEFGLTEDIITENAGRGIAETAVNRGADASWSTVILVLAGNHKTGSRAIAAARHLRNHNVRVTVCVLAMEREQELMDGMRKQLDMYRKVQGRIARWDELSVKLTSGELTPDLVIDALFGMHISFDDMRTDDSGTVFEMISWVNSSESNVLSIDVPSGLSASTGEITSTTSGPLQIQSHFILSLGAPKSGLLMALANEEIKPQAKGWELSVADVGISNQAWKRYGSRRRQGVDFGSDWIVDVKFVAAS